MLSEVFETGLAIFFFMVCKYTFSDTKSSWKSKIVEYVMIVLFIFLFKSIVHAVDFWLMNPYMIMQLFSFCIS